MIICSASNIDLIQGQGTEGYGNADGTTDWRITNTPSATLGLTGVFNIFNSVNPTTPSISILESGTVGIGTVPNVSSAAKMEIIGGINISGSYNINNRDVINDTSNYILNTSNILVSRINATSNTLFTSINTKQNTINSTANQIIIGNGNGVTTTSSSLTFTNNNTLNAPKFVGNGSGLTGLTDTQIPALATSKISGLDTALSGKQNTINSTANQIIIGNGNGSTYTSTALTFSGTTLTATNFSGNGSALTNISSSSHNHDTAYASVSHTHTGYATTTQLSGKQDSLTTTTDINIRHITCNGDLSLGGTSYLRNAYLNSGGEWNSIGLYFSTPFTGSVGSATKSAIIAEAIGSYSRHHLSFCHNVSANNGENVSTGNVYLRFHTDGWIGYYKSLISQSDRRIKRDIEEINDSEALNKILLIQPTTYYYIDETRNRSNKKVYGFIAQQIKDVIPEAVFVSPDIIANIYKTCSVYNKREIYHSIPQDIAINTEVQIYDKKYKIKEIYTDYFVIDEDIDADECFVYGYLVEDVHAIDKTYIFTLNVCATQELQRRIDAQNVVIKTHEERIVDLETKVSMLLNKNTL